MEDDAAAELPEQLEVDVSVKDGGMMLVTALTPELRWQSGAAELALSVRGVKSSPQVCFLAAHIIECSVSLRKPLRLICRRLHFCLESYIQKCALHDLNKLI